MREEDYGLCVALSNYTKNAQKYLESTPIIREISRTEPVIAHILKNVSSNAIISTTSVRGIIALSLVIAFITLKDNLQKI